VPLFGKEKKSNFSGEWGGRLRSRLEETLPGKRKDEKMSGREIKKGPAGRSSSMAKKGGGRSHKRVESLSEKGRGFQSIFRKRRRTGGKILRKGAARKGKGWNRKRELKGGLKHGRDWAESFQAFGEKGAIPKNIGK